jgi:hypothetical protein
MRVLGHGRQKRVGAVETFCKYQFQDVSETFCKNDSGRSLAPQISLQMMKIQREQRSSENVLSAKRPIVQLDRPVRKRCSDQSHGRPIVIKSVESHGCRDTWTESLTRLGLSLAYLPGNGGRSNQIRNHRCMLRIPHWRAWSALHRSADNDSADGSRLDL